MERLTYYENGKARFKIGDTEYSGEVADRLAAYEDAVEQGLLVRRRIMVDNGLLFSSRLKIAEDFAEWANNNMVKNCPENVIAFLDIHGLLNVEKCKEYLQSGR